MTPRRIVIVSRIFAPEPAAASFRLRALARGLTEAAAQVTVLTTRPPAGAEIEQNGTAAAGEGAPVTVAAAPLTVDDLGQALERCGGKQGNKGYDAALVAVRLCDLYRQIDATGGA